MPILLCFDRFFGTSFVMSSCSSSSDVKPTLFRGEIIWGKNEFSSFGLSAPPFSAPCDITSELMLPRPASLSLNYPLDSVLPRQDKVKSYVVDIGWASREFTCSVNYDTLHSPGTLKLILSCCSPLKSIKRVMQLVVVREASGNFREVNSLPFDKVYF